MELPSVYLRSGESKCAKNNIQISVDSKYHTGPNLQQWKPQGWLSKGQGEITPHLPQRPNRLTLRSVSVELFLSDILTPLPVCNCCCWGFSSWWICYPRGTTTAADGLSAGQQQLCPWARWQWLCQTQLLALYPTTKTLPLKPKTWAKWHLNLPEIFSSRYSKEHAKFPFCHWFQGTTWPQNSGIIGNCMYALQQSLIGEREGGRKSIHYPHFLL